MPDHERPHFAFPFARRKTVEQDTEEHIMACANVIVRCPMGFRVERPDYGIPWPEYRQVVSGEAIAIAIGRLEPRAEFSASEARALFDAATSEVTIEVES